MTKIAESEIILGWISTPGLSKKRRSVLFYSVYVGLFKKTFKKLHNTALLQQQQTLFWF